MAGAGGARWRFATVAHWRFASLARRPRRGEILPAPEAGRPGTPSTIRPYLPVRVRHLTSALLLLAAACRGDLSSTLRAPDAPHQKLGVTASVEDVRLLLRTPSAPAGERGGQTVALDAAVTNPQGHVLEHKQHTEWRSTDETIATVDSTGLITAQDTGTVLIIVDEKKAADTVHVRIVPVPVRSVVVAGPDSIAVRDEASYMATPLDSVGEPLLGRDAVAWHSTDELVLKSLSGGAAEGLVTGSAEMEATIEGIVGRASVRVWPATVATVEVSPAPASVPLYRSLTLRASAKDRHGFVLTDRAVTWSSADAAVLGVAGGVVTTVAPGEADVHADVDGVRGTSHVTVTNPVEARALWVTRFEYTGPTSVDFAKIATIFQKAASANFNIVYFQVRTSGDALYFSDLEPCSPRMCGRLGGPRPGQDPLDVALAEAAKYGIQVHAWLNAYTGFIAGAGTSPSSPCPQFIESTPANWLKAHPDWSVSSKNFTTGVITRQVDNCTTTSEYMWVSPGVPEVRAQLATVAADIATRYGPKGLKGIHLDRIRFPALPTIPVNNVSYDPATQEAFRAATGSFPASNSQASWLDFRRGLVNQGVKQVYDAVMAVDPKMVLSAAVFPGYRPTGEMLGWSAQFGYVDLFQDPEAWTGGGYLDVEVPMIYPATLASASWILKSGTAGCTDASKRLDWTCTVINHRRRIEDGKGRPVYVGVGAIKGWTEIEGQISQGHAMQVTGFSVYSFSQVDNAQNNCADCWAKLAAGPFKYPATIPEMGWK
jgi:uncharacterized lipoprotein YddW (UPF0748 family)